MSFGFLGIQFGFALQGGFMSRIFQTLGVEQETIPLLWIAAPLTGLIVQPVVGYLSDNTWHPKYNPKGDKTLPNEKGPNDLEEQIRVLKFRNETLHKHTEKLTQEINTLRIENKRLEKEVAFYVKDQFRNRGEL